MRDLVGVVLANHVVGENDEALSGQIDGSPGHRHDCGVLQASVMPVTVRRYDSRKRTLPSERTVEISTEIEAWNRFEEDFLNGVALPLQFAEDLCVERTLFRHWQQARTGQNLLSQKRRTLEPRLARGKDRHLVMRPGVEHDVSCILRRYRVSRVFRDEGAARKRDGCEEKNYGCVFHSGP